MSSPTFDAVKPGDRIDGKYEVRAILGQGGMGIVVAAMHLDLHELVALKFLLPNAQHPPQAITRFLTEARAVRKLRSEHAIKVLDVGRLSKTGLPYMTMELLQGADLSRVLAERGPLPVDEACGHVIQACDAIAEAHAAGIIHRDLKPANLFAAVQSAGDRPHIKVLDFGIAKVADASGSATKTQAVMGSGFYMSPEQLRSSKLVDHRTDIWALGVTLYELLTHRLPFEREVLSELVLSITNDVPSPPRTYRPDLPDGLQALILRCLDKSPDARPATAAALAAELADYADAPARALSVAIQRRPPPALVPVGGSPDSVPGSSAPSSRARKISDTELADVAPTPSQRRRSRATLGVVAGLAATGLAGLGVWAVLRHPTDLPAADVRAASSEQRPSATASGAGSAVPAPPVVAPASADPAKPAPVPSVSEKRAAPAVTVAAPRVTPAKASDKLGTSVD